MRQRGALLRLQMVLALTLVLVLTLALAPSGMISKKCVPYFCPSTVVLLLVILILSRFFVINIAIFSIGVRIWGVFLFSCHASGVRFWVYFSPIYAFYFFSGLTLGLYPTACAKTTSELNI